MTVRIIEGDCREVLATLPDASVQCCVTSPPYFGLRDYGTAEWEGGSSECDHSQGRPGRKRADPADGLMENGMGRNRDGVGSMGGDCRKCGARRIDRQIGLEASVEAYVAELVAVFREVRRVLRDDGTLWLNLGDSYNGYMANQRGTGLETKRQQARKYIEPGAGLRLGTLKNKDLIGVPWRVAFALQADGWYLRSDIIWAKPNPMPESVRDRPTKAHEYLFLLTKSPRYFWDAEAVKEENSSPEQLAHNLKYAKPYDVYDQRAGETGQPGNVNNVGIHGRPGANGRNIRSVWTIATAPFSDWTQTVRQVRVEPGDADDDTTRITSPDCPVHAGQPDSHPTVAHGERAGARSNRSPGNGTGPALAQVGDSAPTEQRLGANSAGDSWDSLPLLRSLAATDHSNQSHRTDPALATNPPCIPSAQNPDHTERTSALPDSSGSADHTPESNTERDDSAGHPSAQTMPRSADISSCTCSYSREVTESISHFATFPPALAERCIKAGTSEKGACPACGSPWARVVKKTLVPQYESRHGGYNARGNASGMVDMSKTWTPGTNHTETTGWQPTCACPPHEPVPCVTLDPFAGAGTVALVADRLGRDSIAIELNPEYCAMMRKRITGDAPLFAQVV